MMNSGPYSSLPQKSSPLFPTLTITNSSNTCSLMVDDFMYFIPLQVEDEITDIQSRVAAQPLFLSLNTRPQRTVHLRMRETALRQKEVEN